MRTDEQTGPAAVAVSLAGNGYTVLVRADGTGHALAGGTALTARAEPGAPGRDGLQLFVRDLDSGCFWAIGQAGRRGPGHEPPACRATVLGGRYRLEHRQDGLQAVLEIGLVPGRPAELRRLTVTNLTDRTRRLDVTSCAAVVLNDPAAHAAHPVFSKLFLQTRWDAARRALLVQRRPRAPGEVSPTLVHALLDGTGVSFTTSRAAFQGRGRPWDRPAALAAPGPLDGQVGNVLDQVVSLRRAVALDGGASAACTFLFGADADPDAALALCAGLQDPAAVEAALAAASGLTVSTDAPAAPSSATEPTAAVPTVPLPATPELRFDNGLGGFSADGREYVIRVRSDADGNLVLPPQPWTNVLANDRLGCLVSETGAGCTWSGNSRENRLTPWSNDPVLDPHGETLHLRDDGTGAYFSCLPGPTPAGGSYELRHGHGYSRCLRPADGLEVDTLLFVAREAPVRIARVRVRNTGRQVRRLSLFSWCRLVLGTTPAEAAGPVVTTRDQETGALLATSDRPGPFAGHPAFAAVAGDTHVQAIRATPGAGDDPCFAHQVRLEVPAGATAEVAFLLGQETDLPRARALVRELTAPGGAEAAWREARDFWREGLDALQVTTPSPALDLMVNGWLGYQTLACRLRGRTAFYQSGGAFGFRDQLQDALSLLPLWPEVARRQILLNAAHQFVEGDVLHWWHPPDSRGIRTRFADDLVWLPLLASEYIAATGDAAVLDEVAPFLRAPLLAPGVDEVFLTPEDSGEAADLYEHCGRALDRALTRGAHGLPLFGTGDWNDGMNRVGREGRGQSVWMGFFLVTAIDAFLPHCTARGDRDRVDRYRRYRDEVAAALDDTGWDGAWYRRGYYDDGTPLGTAGDTECRIDALAQAWSVLSGVASPRRADQVMDAVEAHLVSEQDGLIRLLTPPFVDTPHDPGYIKGYVAGVRENGGQYTHAALWVVRALAQLGRRNRAAALLDLLNPVHHAATPAQVARYQVEPYVVAADVYGAPPHVGRGGWTWYTGSSGWMLRVALESVLGLRTEGGRTLVLAPCVPDAWPEFRIAWRRPRAAGRWDIHVVNPRRCSEAVVAVTVDGRALPVADGVARIPMPEGGEHRVSIELGPRPKDRP